MIDDALPAPQPSLLDVSCSRRGLLVIAAGTVVFPGSALAAAKQRPKDRQRRRRKDQKARQRHRAKASQSGFVYVAGWGKRGFGHGEFILPKRAAVDGDGNVYIADLTNGVQKFTSDGQFLLGWVRQGVVPTSVAIGPVETVVYVANEGYLGDATIQKWKTDGTFISEWGSSGNGQGQFRQPSGIAIDNSGNVYVMDAGNARIQKFTGNGAFVRMWGSEGNGPGQFNTDGGIAVDSAGNVFVIDSINQRVQQFSSDGDFVSQWTAGSGARRFRMPNDIALDSQGNVYVTDVNTGLVQQFDRTGHFLAQIGHPGRDPGEFGTPTGIAIDSAGNVYVADYENFDVQKFSPV